MLYDKAMRKPRHLVVNHLEDISRKVLQDYRQVIKEMIRGHSGIYALYRRDKLYYVGLASNLMGRLDQHLKDKHGNNWDRFSVYLTVHNDHMKELESLLLRIVNPSGNAVSGRFSQSTNLKHVLNQQMKDQDADKRASLMGGKVAQRRRRVKIAKKDSSKPVLAGVIDRGIRLRAWRKGWEYHATLRKNGLISYDGKMYVSPSAAAKAALRQKYNGWAFWHYRDQKTESGCH